MNSTERSSVSFTDRSSPRAPRRVLRALLRRVRWVLRWLRPPRRLKLTREGRFYIFITFGVGFVGVLTANNLLYVLLGVLLSLIVVSGVLSEASLQGLRVTRRLPLRAQVGRPHLVEIEVHNDKKRMPSYAIEVEDLRRGQPADKRCFFLKVSPGASQVAAYRRIPARRGRDQHTGFRVATRFPFGFFEKSREFSSLGDLVIYPAVDSVTLPRPLGAGFRQAEGSALQRGSGDEVMGLRLMREGDDPRDIYWKRSTFKGPKTIRERASDVLSRAQLSLDDVASDQSPSVERVQLFERQVRDVASRAVAHLRRGEPVVIRTQHGEVVSCQPSEGADKVLRFLALVDLVTVLADGSVRPTTTQRPPARPFVFGRRADPVGVVVAPVHLSRPAPVVRDTTSSTEIGLQTGSAAALPRRRAKRPEGSP